MRKIVAIILLAALVSGQAAAATIQLDHGWNMISVDSAVGLDEIENTECFLGPVWWDNDNKHWEYEIMNLLPERAYYVYVEGSGCEIDYPGDEASNPPDITLYDGWNMISVSQGSLTKSAIEKQCELDGGPLRYDNSDNEFEEVDEMVPNEGYWVETGGLCNLEQPSVQDSSLNDDTTDDTTSSTDDSIDDSTGETSGETDGTGIDEISLVNVDVPDDPELGRSEFYVGKKYRVNYKIKDEGERLSGVKVKTVYTRTEGDSDTINWKTINSRTCNGNDPSKCFSAVSGDQSNFEVDKPGKYKLAVKIELDNSKTVMKQKNYEGILNPRKGWETKTTGGEEVYISSDSLPFTIDTTKGDYKGGYCGAAYFKKKFSPSSKKKLVVDLYFETGNLDDGDNHEIKLTAVKDGDRTAKEGVSNDAKGIDEFDYWPMEAEVSDHVVRVGMKDDSEDRCNTESHSTKIKIRDITLEE